MGYQCPLTTGMSITRRAVLVLALASAAWGCVRPARSTDDNEMKIPDALVTGG
jgi:hypothetical protein